MNRHHLLLFAFLFISFTVAAQKKDLPLLLKDGVVRVLPAITSASIDSFHVRAPRFKNKTFAVLQFEELPSESLKTELARQGIQLLDYIPTYAYTVTITGKPDVNTLTKAKARALINLKPQQKMHSLLTDIGNPAWAILVPGTVDVSMSFPKSYTDTEVMGFLKSLNFTIINTELLAYRVLNLRIAANRVIELASYPFVAYVQPVLPKDEPLNDLSRNAARSGLLNRGIADGGRGLNGEGVVIGVGDNADIQYHVDFSGRLINRSAAPQTNHGVHVSGTVGGAGIINPAQRGYAPGATILSQLFSGILNNAATYVQDYGMVITNNSYGNIIGCDYNGIYDLYSHILDQQAFDLPHLQHVFATGNSGTSTCGSFPQGFQTVLGGYQSAKNVISVGATDWTGVRWSNSSKGPVRDGRLKPEITAMGASVISTTPNNGYGYGSGTSMAAPAVSGGLALLYQRYRQLHGADPKSGLMKALLCNGAADKGNNGPDYSYGYGWMNLLRSTHMLENNRYVTGASTQGSANNFTITVPANTAEVKVMLYWHDPAASLLSSQTLVNDLDLEVTDAAANRFLPGILNAANVTAVAATGPDHLNNMEQVVVTNPAAGTYTISVTGTAIAQNPSQEYYVVYDIIPAETTLTYPVGGETFAPGEQLVIQWDAYGTPTTEFTLQYSTDNGASWMNIVTNSNAASRQYSWTVPGTVTEAARVRVVRNGTGFSSASLPFVVLDAPVITLSATQCEGYIAVEWNTISSATEYEIVQLQNGAMHPVAVLTGNAYTISGLHRDSVYWVSVRARINGKWGKRAIAISRQPASGVCMGTISDNDMALNRIVSPVSGRSYTSTALTNATPVSIEIKNLDDVAASNVVVKYRINNGAWVMENVATPITGGGVYTHVFSTPADLSAIGSYTLEAVVQNSNYDGVTKNDTLVKTVRHLSNEPIDLALPFIDNLEGTFSNTYTSATAGLVNRDRYDLESTTAFGRLRTFVNTGMAYSGANALTLDADRYLPDGSINYLVATYNLQGYTVAANDLRFDFQYNNHGQTPHPQNRVWVRGSDSAPWIEALSLDSVPEVGVFKKSGSIQLSRLLAGAGQEFSTSFQVRWGQYGKVQATDKETGEGFTFDDIRLYQAQQDAELVRIDAPLKNSCALGNETIAVTVRNNASSLLLNVPIQYRINNGGWITETIGSIPAGTSIAYNFATPANLSAVTTYTLEVMVAYPGDNFSENDTARVTITNKPVVTAFPYLQNFEGGPAGWHAEGKNSSWEYGIPQSNKINRSASGANSWKTRLAGNYNDKEQSYLYSPCFDVSTLTQPALSFSMAIDFEDCGAVTCDGAWMEYSTDGTTWVKLGTNGSGTNWYNKTTQLWSLQNYNRWHVATTALPTGANRLQLRFVVASDAGVNREGIALDDIHIYDNTAGIYDGITLAAPLIQTISGNEWVHFESGGKRVVSVRPANENLGTTAVEAFIHTGSVRNHRDQYYHNRNVTIKPATGILADSVAVQMYFLDTEAEALLNATGCVGCSKPASAYELGISKYTDPNKTQENGTLSDNNGGQWLFIPPANVTIVPFDKGYYAEFKVKDFSEFWLNNGSFNGLTPLPAQLLQFTAQKLTGTDVQLNWTTATEQNVSYYEVEVARNTAGYNSNSFVSIGRVNSQGDNTQRHAYMFTDIQPNKSGTYYYRLKIADKDGRVQYSAIRPVVFNGYLVNSVMPNPGSGLFYVTCQAPAGELLQVRVTDALGKHIKEVNVKSDGFMQKIPVDISGQAAGVYLLSVYSAGKTETYTIYKK